LAGKNADIRLLNAIPDDVALDVILPDGTVLIEGLKYRDEVAELDLPAGSYDLLITRSGEPDTILFSLTGVNLYGGMVYYLAAIVI